MRSQVPTTYIVSVLLICDQAVPSWTLREDDFVEETKLDLWSRGAYDLDEYDVDIGSDFIPNRPVSYVRRELLAHRRSPFCDLNGYCSIRGGNAESPTEYMEQVARKIDELGSKLGADFMDAIERNKREHAEDCTKSCELYYCEDPSKPLIPFGELMGKTTLKSYTMGPVPPEDFAESFG